jgi:hypothetical protein
MTPEYQQILIEETEKAKQFTSNHDYSLKEMGLESQSLSDEFEPAMKEYGTETALIK